MIDNLTNILTDILAISTLIGFTVSIFLLILFFLKKTKKIPTITEKLFFKNITKISNMENFSKIFISYGKEGVTGDNIRHFLISAAKFLDKKNTVYKNINSQQQIKKPHKRLNFRKEI